MEKQFKNSVKLQDHFYEMIKEDPFLQGKLLKVLPTQNIDSLISLAHTKHNVFSVSPQVNIILDHYNQPLPEDEKILITDMIQSCAPVYTLN